MRQCLFALAGLSVLFTVVAAAQEPAPAAWQPPPPTPTAIHGHPAAFKTDRVEFTLQPNEGMEYKYRLERDAAFLFSWSATGPVHFEMHSEPDGAPKTFAETFDKQDDRTEAHGSYKAPFSGIHGWYWQNRTMQPVTLTLNASGFFTESREYRRGRPTATKPF